MSKSRSYETVARALQYIDHHYKEQPALASIAAHVGLSPQHFQRLFTKWAGTSPKKFMQYVNLAHAKALLKHEQNSLLKTTSSTGLSSAGRLHDLFVTIEAMTPGEYKNGGAGLVVKYSFFNTQFGEVLIASTVKGVTHISFITTRPAALLALQDELPNARLISSSDAHQRAALALFKRTSSNAHVQLHLKGTPFQLKIWEALLTIPVGARSSYRTIAEAAGTSRAHRAVGTAIGKNPVAYLIPCHRVIRSSGAFGNYRWGNERKMAMLGWESAAHALQTANDQD